MREEKKKGRSPILTWLAGPIYDTISLLYILSLFPNSTYTTSFFLIHIVLSLSLYIQNSLSLNFQTFLRFNHKQIKWGFAVLASPQPWLQPSLYYKTEDYKSIRIQLKFHTSCKRTLPLSFVTPTRWNSTTSSKPSETTMSSNRVSFTLSSR